jgi:nanoRNase/pAp phosphatase (c-di-AMP/oligoRNAs hydrolase)
LTIAHGSDRIKTQPGSLPMPLEQKLKTLDPGNKVLIMPHDNPDPDALASAWGLSFLLKKERGISATIAYGGLIGRAENRAMVHELDIPLSRYHRGLLDEHDRVIMVDCQPHTGNSSLPDDIDPDIVIDHHPRRESTRAKLWDLIVENIGATSTLIASNLKSTGYKLPVNLVTALFYAISSETKELGWEGTQTDYENYVYLLPHVDFQKLHRITHPELSKKYYQSLNQALTASRVYQYAVITPMDDVPYPELPAEIADFLLFRENIQISFVSGIYEQSLFLSMRSLNRDINTADIMLRILEDLGQGGGHLVMAGGKISGISASSIKKIRTTLKQRFLSELSLNEAVESTLY